ncbi:unnamed protein product [Phyllotreta striolata]|uniref:DNA polymerase theta n=1 Tax=Phyllotreta striolata TaxID=444603 RepID=A0A9N9TX65_PHYSR|nr:unnamed protein product [Phyllotreta striolata]
MNDLLLNDTLENFYFSQRTNNIIKENLEFNSKNVLNNLTNLNGIFDDSLNFSQLTFANNECEHSNETEIPKDDSKETPQEDNSINLDGNSSNSIDSSPVEIHSQVQLSKLSTWDLPESILRKYESKNLTTMFPWQVECLSLPGVLEGKNLVYSAPTSAGKTLVAELIAIKTIIERKKKVIFILPFVSIVREKMFYFQNLLEGIGIRVDGFMGSYHPPGGFKSLQLAICTIEKANSLINRLMEENQLSDIGAVLIDEMHLLGDSSRGYLLELLLTKLRYVSKKDDLQIQLIGMSATLPNLKEVANWLDAALYTTDYRPVPLKEQALVCGEIYDNNLKPLRKLEILPELGKDSDNVLQLCLETIKMSCSVLIFCPTKTWCESLALQIAKGFMNLGSSGSWSELLRSQLDRNLIVELLEQLKNCPVGLDEVLLKTASFGVAFHHAGLTMDERDILEGAFRNGALRVIVATSTLSSGVNLPARRVIIRTPMFHGKPLDPLVYRQMIGRAGRMGRDSEGESFVIGQKSDLPKIKNLMTTELNPVKSCLEKGGKLNRAILEVIASGVASTPEDVKLFTENTLLASGCFDDLINPVDEALDFLQANEFVRLQELDKGHEKYQPTALGKACLSSSIAPDEGLSLFKELEKARQCIVLETELHLIYLVTPYNACYSWENIDWMLFLDLWEKLPPSMRKVGELVGIQDAFLVKATRSKILTNTEKLFRKYLVHKRFFVALALQDLVNEKPLNWVCDKFSCNRGMLQSLQQSASSFAGMVTAFCKQLGWTSMELLLSQFQERMQFGVSRDLLDLMHLSVLSGKTARLLYNAGLETVIQLANSDVPCIENVLHKSMPFESDKNREGESDSGKQRRNKYRNVWIAGREGLSERQAAEIFVAEARKYLKIELGLVDAKWDNEQESSCTIVDAISDDKINLNTTNNTHNSEDHHSSTEATLIHNVIEDNNNNNRTTLHVKDTIDHNDQSKSIQPNENPVETVEENPNDLSLELERKCSLNSPKKVVSNLLNDISISDFSGTFSEISSNHRNTSTERIQSDESSLEENFSLQLSQEKDSSALFQTAFNDTFRSDEDMFCNSMENSELLSISSSNKRKEISFEEKMDTKKFKEVETKNIGDGMYNWKSNVGCNRDFGNVELIKVCENTSLLDTFRNELKTKKAFAFSIACSRFVKAHQTIGTNILKLQNGHRNDSNDSPKGFVCDERKLEGFAFSWKSNSAFYLSMDNVKLHQTILNLLKVVFRNRGVSVRMFDSKRQIKFLKNCCGINFYCKIDDPNIGDWLLEPEESEKTFQSMVLKYYPEGLELARSVGDYKGAGSIGLNVCSTVDPMNRSSIEAVLTWHLSDNLNELLLGQYPNLSDTFDIENNVMLILAKIELNGFSVNKTLLNNLLENIKSQIIIIEKKAYSLAGRKFNFLSSADVAKVTGIFKGKKVSTRKEILEKIEHPISDLVLQWRKLHSILTRTVYPLINAIKIDKIHGCYYTYTATGRISMHEPSLQTINRDFSISISTGGNTISCREIFEATEGYELLSADYCQLELRILTHFSEDGLLTKIMSEQGDVFKSIAAKWNRITEDEVTDSIRQNAKHLCYGIIYGMGCKTLAAQLDSSEEEAAEFVETFMRTYPGIKSFINRTLERCRRDGYVETISGRKRYLPHINECNLVKKGQAERQAVNTIVQGSAADLVKRAMITVDKELEEIFHKAKNKPKLVLFLHDELMYEVPIKYLKKVAKVIKRNMESSFGLSIPFPVKLKHGKSWSNLMEFNL